jgi:hypothetical protein
MDAYSILSFIPAPIRLPKAELGRVPISRRFKETAEIAQVGFDALVIQMGVITLFYLALPD